MKYALGFSWMGFIAVMLVMLPNIFYFRFPPANIPDMPQDRGHIINIVENTSRIIFMILLIFMVNGQKVKYISPYTACMLVLLLLYYWLWCRYFTGGRNYSLLNEKLLFIPEPMAVFPVLYFIAAALWLNNIPAAAAAAVFGITHIVNTYITFR